MTGRSSSLNSGRDRFFHEVPGSNFEFSRKRRPGVDESDQFLTATVL